MQVTNLLNKLAVQFIKDSRRKAEILNQRITEKSIFIFCKNNIIDNYLNFWEHYEH